MIIITFAEEQDEKEEEYNGVWIVSGTTKMDKNIQTQTGKMDHTCKDMKTFVTERERDAASVVVIMVEIESNQTKTERLARARMRTAQC